MLGRGNGGKASRLWRKLCKQRRRRLVLSSSVPGLGIAGGISRFDRVPWTTCSISTMLFESPLRHYLQLIDSGTVYPRYPLSRCRALPFTLDMSLVVDNADVIFAVDRIPDSKQVSGHPRHLHSYPKIDGFVGLKRVKQWISYIINVDLRGNPFRFSVVAMTIAAFSQSLSTLPLGTKNLSLAMTVAIIQGKLKVQRATELKLLFLFFSSFSSGSLIAVLRFLIFRSKKLFALSISLLFLVSARLSTPAQTKKTRLFINRDDQLFFLSTPMTTILDFATGTFFFTTG